jgi:hypothetical protein
VCSSDVKGKDSIRDLRSSVYYYENVAEADGDSVRKATIEKVATELKQILMKVEQEIEGMLRHRFHQYGITCSIGIDQQIKTLRDEAAHIFEVPELQEYQV